MQDRTELKFAASVRMANIRNKMKQKTNKGLREGSMVKVVKALAALAEDRGLDISIHMAVSNWDLVPSSNPQGYCMHRVHLHTCRQTHPHKNNQCWQGGRGEEGILQNVGGKNTLQRSL